MSRSPHLLIVGASVRAAASSARRAGFAPTAVDLFADRDLSARFPTHRADRETYPVSLAEIAARLTDSPWIYTGAVENHPRLVAQIARRRPLLGIVGDALIAVRDPRIWTSTLDRAGIPILESRQAGDRLPSIGSWLVKPLGSASGHGIRPWPVGSEPIPVGCHLQSFRRGLSVGATFLGDGRSARLVGLTRQLLGKSDQGLRVIYRGSIGPWPVAPEVGEVIARMGMILANEFGLRGLFGIDLIVSSGVPWPVEINPRYSASVEVIESALGLNLIADHARAFGFDVPTRQPAHPDRFAAKLILFARFPGIVPTDWPWTDPTAARPTVADLPAPGTILSPGDPVLTVLARGASLASTVDRLRSRASVWRRRIDGWR